MQTVIMLLADTPRSLTTILMKANVKIGEEPAIKSSFSLNSVSYSSTLKAIIFQCHNAIPQSRLTLTTLLWTQIWMISRPDHQTTIKSTQTVKPVLTKLTFHIWVHSVHSYFPNDTTYVVLFREMIPIN